MGDDATEYSTANTVVFSYIYDGGSFQLLPMSNGRYITVRRDSSSPVGDAYNLRQMKVYQVPDLLQASGITAAITADTSASATSDDSADNLIQNCDNRSGGNNLKALKNAAQEQLS